MKQEQKPFDEIRRLQSELKRKSEACIHFAKANQCFMEANMELQQQLADAPTWGEWVDAMAENIENPYLNVSLYEFEFDNGALEILSLTQEMKWLTLDGNDVTGEFYSNDRDVLPVRFRRLNYEPKPAREVEPPEKKYNLLGYHVTVAEMAEWRGNPDLNMPNIGELARDFLAVQAELRELKGE